MKRSDVTVTTITVFFICIQKVYGITLFHKLWSIRQEYFVVVLVFCLHETGGRVSELFFLSVCIGGRAYWVGQAFAHPRFGPTGPTTFCCSEVKKQLPAFIQHDLLSLLHSNEPHLLSPDAFCSLKMHQNAFVLGELTVLPDLSARFSGCTGRESDGRVGWGWINLE